MANPSMHATAGIKIYLVLAPLVPLPVVYLASFLSHIVLDWFPEFYSSPYEEKHWYETWGLAWTLELLTWAGIVAWLWFHASWAMTGAMAAAVLMDAIDGLVVQRFTGKNLFPCHPGPRVRWIGTLLTWDYEWQTNHIDALATGMFGILFAWLVLS